MATVESPGNQQLPAVDPKLANYVDTATARLQAWARADGQNWDTLTDPDALLLQTLLAKSRPESKRGVVPILPLSEFKNLLNEALTERRWEKFLRWFDREISKDLARTCGERAEPMLYPARMSNGNGGRAVKGQAIYFLSFEAPSLLREPRTADTLSPAPVEREIRDSKPEAPPVSAKGGGTSSNATESPDQKVAGNPEAKSDGRDQESRPARPGQPLDQDAPLWVFLGLHSTTPSGGSLGWISALALILFFATSAEPASAPLTDEILRVLTAVQEVLSGAVIIRF